jgi:MFS transporter, BCD family, chlorophyll transporter
MTTTDPDVPVAISSFSDSAGLEITHFNIRQTLRLSSFHIGSAMGDILATSVWNRIMITELGIPAWPVGLLIAMRYLLSPLSLWAGNRSDTSPIAGLYRTPYIWFGRALMVLSFPLLGASVGRLSDDTTDVIGWLAAVLCFMMYGLGTLLSGSPFLALVRDSSPKAKQGLAISLVETVMIVLFPVAAIGFGRWMQEFNETVFWELVLVTAGVGGFFWFFAILGVERRILRQTGRRPVAVEQPGITATFRAMWQDSRTRMFFIFLSLATFSAWMQDNVLEPFGGEIFDLNVGQTTRFTGYWGGATVVTLLSGFVVWRKRPPERQDINARSGLWVMAVGMGLLTLASLAGQERLIIIGLVIYGGGFGVYTFGGLSLLAVMSPDVHAGAYLGLWTISILVFKGLGTFAGGVIRDLGFAVNLSAEVAYGLVFLIAALGLATAGVVISRLDVIGFARDSGRLGGDYELPSIEL